MFNYKDIKMVHLEITDRCNASCPQCARNIMGGRENPYLTKSELSLEELKKIFNPMFTSSLKRVYLCGNYGDPIIGKDTLSFLKYLRSQNDNMSLSLNTNGSAQRSEWWKELARVINGKGDVKFGIDGLVDTHAIYRRGTDFNKIIENAKAFISKGGNAVWEFIVFKHNEHEVDEARRMANELGFKKFTVKKTGRFFSNSKLIGKDKQGVYSEDKELEYYIESPIKEEFKNSSLSKEKNIIEKYGSMESYLDQVEINCKTLKEGSLYISSEGLVFPCCWTANQLYLWYFRPRASEIWSVVNEVGGLKKLSALNYEVKDIVEGEFFKRISERWSCPSLKSGKLKTCSKTCGTVFDQFKDQYL